MRIRGDAGPGLFMPGDGGTVRAKQLDRRLWRDPRLTAGVLLILASTVVGGWVVAAADDTESYWAVRGDVRAGDPVRRADLVAIRAKVPGPTASGLLRTNRPLPGRLANLRWASDARGGTLITDAALASRSAAVELPIAVSLAGVPGDLRRGDRVDVWSVSERSGEATSVAAARRLLSGVRVVSRTSATGITGGPGVTLVVDAAGTTIDSKLITALAAGRVIVVRVS